MDIKEITRYKNYLLNTLKMHGEYDDATGLHKKALLVEGYTDKKFFDHIKGDTVRCISVAEFMKVRDAFSTTPSRSQNQYNCKTVILSIIDSIARYPVFVNFPKGAEKWPLYGIVDKDYDDVSQYCVMTKLFFTDTCDLETLMVSTDEKLLTRLKSCTITAEEARRALYISHQLAVFKQAIRYNGSLNANLAAEADGTIAFDVFTKDDMVDLTKLLNHINGKSGKPLSREKIKRIKGEIIKNLKKWVDSDGIWKKTENKINMEADSDIWLTVNGHEVLSAIRYINPDAKEAFNNQGEYGTNRDFEIALSDVYDYSCLKKTNLYSNLIKEGLLKS